MGWSMNADVERSSSGELSRLISRISADLGVELVDVAMRGAGGRRVLRVDIDRPGPSGVGIEDCQKLSHAIGEALEENDLIPYRYVLEVSSPGADRPIRSMDDARRNTGRMVVVESRDDDGKTQTVRGKLAGCDGDALIVESDSEQTVSIPLERVVKAHQALEL